MTNILDKVRESAKFVADNNPDVKVLLLLLIINFLLSFLLLFFINIQCYEIIIIIFKIDKWECNRNISWNIKREWI